MFLGTNNPVFSSVRSSCISVLRGIVWGAAGRKIKEYAPGRPFGFAFFLSFCTCLRTLVTCREALGLLLLRREKDPTLDLYLFFLVPDWPRCLLARSVWTLMSVLGKPLAEKDPGRREFLPNCLFCLSNGTSDGMSSSHICGCLWLWVFLAADGIRRTSPAFCEKSVLPREKKMYLFFIPHM